MPAIRELVFGANAELMKQVTQKAWPVHPDTFSNAEGCKVPDGNWAVKALHLVKSLSQRSWSAGL